MIPIGRGFEYKSGTTLFGLPLIHISFKFKCGKPVVAKRILAIGQFAVGYVTIAQFGLGILSAGQFSVGVFAIGQSPSAEFAVV